MKGMILQRGITSNVLYDISVNGGRRHDKVQVLDETIYAMQTRLQALKSKDRDDDSNNDGIDLKDQRLEFRPVERK